MLRDPRPAEEKRFLVVGYVVVAIVVAIVAGLIRQDSVRARHDLDGRFHTRAELSASFARQFIDDLAVREQRQAERLLAGAVVDQATFDQVVDSFDFDAAVLLDARGRLLLAHPAAPALEGQDMTVEYEHLRLAIGGQVGVSRMVPSAVDRIPIAAVATPFQTPSGQRVMSGAFSPERTPLGAYFSSVVPVSGGNAFLVDDHAELLTEGGGDTEVDAVLRATTEPISHLDTDAGQLTAASEVVEGAPWRVVLVAPSGPLYAPVDGGGWFAWLLWGALAVLGIAIVQLTVHLNRARARSAQHALTDELTGLPNRRAMLAVLAHSGRHARRGSGAAALLIDIDHFKRVNDVHGHPAGDEALRIVAAVLRRSVREGDVAGRWGGEEFLVVLQPTASAGPEDVAERIREAIAAAPMPFGGEAARCTVSIGAAWVVDGDVDEALRAADLALYRAKGAGRDCVEMAPAPA